MLVVHRRSGKFSDGQGYKTPEISCKTLLLGGDDASVSWRFPISAGHIPQGKWASTPVRVVRVIAALAQCVKEAPGG